MCPAAEIKEHAVGRGEADCATGVAGASGSVREVSVGDQHVLECRLRVSSLRYVVLHIMHLFCLH